MFGIESYKKSQADLLEEEYKQKYLKYKEKYLKLKQSGGFGKTSSGVHCILTTKELATTVETLLKQKKSLNDITLSLHDQAYVIKDGSNEVELVLSTAVTTDKLKNMFATKIYKNVEKVTNTEVMNRCDDKSIQAIRKAIKAANIAGKKITIERTKTASGSYNEKRNTQTSTATKLDSMIVINFASVGNDHKLIGNVKNVKPPKTPGQSTDTD